MPSSWGISFEEVDLELSSERWNDLRRLGIPSYPATILGDRAVHRWNSAGLAALVGVNYDPGKRRGAKDLAAMLDAILAANYISDRWAAEFEIPARRGHPPSPP